MAYISAVKRGDEIYVWERDEHDKRFIRKYPAPWFFYTEDPRGSHTSIYGEKLERHDFETSGQFYDARDQAKQKNKRIYESDIPPEVKILSEHYFEKPAPKLHITFFDIEIDYDPNIGFAGTTNPYAPINSVALYHNWKNKFVVIAVPPSEGYTEEQLRKDIDAIAPVVGDYDLMLVDDEMDLLLQFLVEIEDADVISGWNSSGFDTPYICQRLEKTLGQAFFKKMSFDGAPKPKYKDAPTPWGGTRIEVELFGRSALDYMELFKKYEAAERPSFSLENISNEVTPELTKLEYEGTLHKLYRENFAFFLRYNIRDTECLKGFEEKLGYVALANEMIHISTGLFKHVLGSLKLHELAIINYCHYKFGKVVPDWSEKPDDTIQGAYVLLPQVGLHENIAAIDINSLYPSSIRSINISPETLRGQFKDKVEAADAITKNTNDRLLLLLEDGNTEEHTAAKWREILKSRTWSVSGYGTVYDQTQQGIIPAVLEDWYNQRVLYKNKAKDEYKKGNKDKYAYYDRLQYIYKIKLNSLYGSLTNPFFKFFDLRNGQSTTATGRAILRHQCSEICRIITGEYALPDRKVYDDTTEKTEIGYSDKYPVIYGDTDSTYFKVTGGTVDEVVDVADSIAEQVNDSYQGFMQRAFLCNPGFDHIIKAGRELVSDRGIFVDKKRYVLHIVDLEGARIDKLKVMGLDTKKTTLPKTIQVKLNNFIERFLKGEDWDNIAEEVVDLKEQLLATDDILTIGLPKGIKGIERYTVEYKIDKDIQLPGHVAASMFYNQCLEEFDDKESIAVSSGMKIAVFYLKKKFGRFKSIALPKDLEVIPEWFKVHFIPLIDRDAQVQRLIDQPIQNIIRAIDKEPPTKQTLAMSKLLSFDD